MPSFILRNLDPDFWRRVQAKATAEGVTIKAVILRLLTTWLGALAIACLSACAPHAPGAPTPIAQISETDPFTLSLGATVGFGPDAGHATVNAKVQNVKGTPLAGVLVTFVTDVGAFSATPVETGADGLASTTITAASTAAISATAGTVTTKTLVTSQPVPPAPPAPQPPIYPPPPPPPPAPGPFAATVTTNGTVTVGTPTFFTITVNAPAASVAWTFGDGTTFAGASPTTGHTYAAIGSYPASVTVTDTRGRTASATTTAIVTAVPPPPPPPAPAFTATLSVTAPSTTVGGTLSFSVALANLAVGETVTAYQWDLDGTASYESTTTVATRVSAPYATAGLFTAKVLVTTSSGRSTIGSVGFVVTN